MPPPPLVLFILSLAYDRARLALDSLWTLSLSAVSFLIFWQFVATKTGTRIDLLDNFVVKLTYYFLPFKIFVEGRNPVN